MTKKKKKEMEFSQIPLPIIHRDFEFTSKDIDFARLRKPIRATTYQVVAKGPCPYCLNGIGPVVPLQFVYNPSGDDFLVCQPHANDINERFKEDSETP